MANFVLFLSMSILILNEVIRTSKDNIPSIRKMPALDAIREAVGRATEMGRSVHLGTGIGKLIDQHAQHTIAGLTICGYAAEIAAEYNTPVIYNCAVAHVLPAAQAIIGDAYKKYDAKLDDAYTFRYVGDNQRAYIASVNSTFARDKPAANIMAGAWKWEALTVADIARQTGAINIGAAARMYAFCYFLACCDYTLIGEELFVAGAYLSQDAKQLGSIKGQDMCKLLIIALIMLTLIFPQSLMGLLRM